MHSNTPKDYIRPDFLNQKRTYDWKNYGSARLWAIWDEFTESQKAVIAECLQATANNEGWDR